MTEFENAVRWLEDVPRYGQKDGLHNMRRLMERFGHPEQGLKVIHVAGTNGKGSCCAMLQQILVESGFRTGLYTSPHLVDYCERIRIGRERIPRTEFVRLLDRVRAENDALVEEGYPHATFFEFLTAMAFLYFAEQQVDYVVLEVGVGGRLDATNIIERPLVSLITSISLDHTKTLGDTLELIAAEKAGIMKPGCPVVCAANPSEVRQVFRRTAAERGCLLLMAGDTPDYTTSLKGDYQQENTAAVETVVDVLRMQGVPIPEPAVADGLWNVRWPGRMQEIRVPGPGGRESVLLLEGAHNPDAAERLGDYITRRKEPALLLFGALSKKDTFGVLKGLLRAQPYIRGIQLVPIEGADCLSRGEMARMLEELDCALPWMAYANVDEALDIALDEPYTVVAGSLYLVGEVLKALEKRTGDEYF